MLLPTYHTIAVELVGKSYLASVVEVAVAVDFAVSVSVEVIGEGGLKVWGWR